MKRVWLPFDAVAIIIALALCLALAFKTYPLRNSWVGLSPAPSAAEALAYGYGDVQLSYRTIGMMLQNTGDIGGRVTNFRDYNYARLRDWLYLSYALDDKANFIPSLAAYYFGATQKHEDVRYLVDYLAMVGKDNVTGEERWRWLAQAVYLARFELEDQDKALELAQQLSDIATPDMPIWTKQMPAFVLSKVGKKKAARDLMLTIAATDKTMQRADLNQTCWYIDHNLRESDDGLDTNEVYQALCKPLKQD